MRLAALPLVLASACTSSHQITGKIATPFFDCQSTTLTASDDSGVIDAQTPGCGGWDPIAFSVTVPDGETHLSIVFQLQSVDHDDADDDTQRDYEVDGPITADVDLGTVEL